MTERTKAATRLAALLAAIGALNLGATECAPPVPVASGLTLALNWDFPDPDVLKVGNAYYAYATNASVPFGFGSVLRNVPVAKSDDLVHWDYFYRPGEGFPADALEAMPAWSGGGFGLTWAPGLVQRDSIFGPYYALYFTRRHAASGRQCIGVATSYFLYPGGPFAHAGTAPLVCQTGLGGSIDGSPFVDADGRLYLLWKDDRTALGQASALWSAPLNATGDALAGAPVALLSGTENWERPTWAPNQPPLVEGPSMVLQGGTYYLFYSGSSYSNASYAIGYATCSSPLGPCVKRSVGAPWYGSNDGVWGPGGQDFVRDAAGTLRMLHHGYSPDCASADAGCPRKLYVQTVTFR